MLEKRVAPLFNLQMQENLPQRGFLSLQACKKVPARGVGSMVCRGEKTTRHLVKIPGHEI